MSLILVALIAALALSSRAAPPPAAKGSADLDLLRGMAREAGMDSDWENFLAAVAWRESKWFPRVALGRAERVNVPNVKVNGGPIGNAEAAAALLAYDRNADEYKSCPWPRMRYGFGSGGWYGLLPANALWSFKATPAFCIDPQVAVFDPWDSTILAIGYAQRLMRWKSFRARPTWRTLNRGWAAPSLMDGSPPEQVAKTDARFLKALARLGLPASFADEKVPELPAGWNAFSVWATRGTTA